MIVREGDPQFRVPLARRERRAEIVGGGLSEKYLIEGLVQRQVDGGVQARALRAVEILPDRFIIVAPHLAEDQELLVAAFRGERLEALILRIRLFQEVVVKALGRIVHGVDSKTIHSDLFYPKSIDLAHASRRQRIVQIHIVQITHRVRQRLPSVAIVVDVRREVVHAGFAVRGVARVVHLEHGIVGRLRLAVRRVGPGDRAPAALRVLRVVALGGHGEEVGGVVDDDVLDHLHAQRVGVGDHAPVVLDRAEVGVHGGEVVGPVAVVAARGDGRVDPLAVGRRRQPDRVDAQALQARQAPAQALEVAALELLGVGRRVLVAAEVVARGVAVGEAVEEDEIEDLARPRGQGIISRHGRARARSGAARRRAVSIRSGRGYERSSCRTRRGRRGRRSRPG